MSELKNIIPLTGTIIASTDSASAAASAAAAAASAASASESAAAAAVSETSASAYAVSAAESASSAEGSATSAKNAADVVNSAIIDVYNNMCDRSTVSGAIASGHFVPGYPLDYKAYVNATQSGTGDPSPDNVRQITGADALTIYCARYKPIGAAHGSEIESWAQVKQIVKYGLGPRLLPIGTQLAVNHSVYGTKLYDVVAHDYLKSAWNPNAFTMTLLQHDLLPAVQFDAPEAFYYAETELPAGTYYFTLYPTRVDNWTAGTYQFTITQSLPAGGQLAISGDASASLMTRKVYAYASRTATVKTEECIITAEHTGTNLGILGKELNSAERISYGANNYKKSAIRQFLNSDAAAGAVWTPQTKYDRPPTWVSTLDGFVRGLDADFVDAIGEVSLPCSTNNIYESPDSTTPVNTKYTLYDRLYLASRMEIFGSQDGVADDSLLFPYYDGATNAGRIKYMDGSAQYWSLRTPHASTACVIRLAHPTGIVSNDNVRIPYAIAPACTIVG